MLSGITSYFSSVNFFNKEEPQLLEQKLYPAIRMARYDELTKIMKNNQIDITKPMGKARYSPLADAVNTNDPQVLQILFTHGEIGDPKVVKDTVGFAIQRGYAASISEMIKFPEIQNIITKDKQCLDLGHSTARKKVQENSPFRKDFQSIATYLQNLYNFIEKIGETST